MAAVSKSIATIHVKALITAFQEVESYEPHLHHNRQAPALWIDDQEYLGNVKELIRELRRFNELLEAKKENSQAIAKSAGLLGKMYEKFWTSAAGASGVGAVGLAGASLYAVISSTELGAEILRHLPVVGKGK